MNPKSARFAGGPWYGQPPRRIIALFAVIWTLLAIMATLVIHALVSPQRTDFAHIAARPVATVALVTLSDPSNHDSFLYRYRVGQQSYIGGRYPQARVQPEAASLHVGQACRLSTIAEILLSRAPATLASPPIKTTGGRRSSGASFSPRLGLQSSRWRRRGE